MWKTHRITLGIPAAIALALALPGVQGDFVTDDRYIVPQRGGTAMGLSGPKPSDFVYYLSEIPGYWVDNYWGDYAEGGLYRPLTLTTFALEKTGFSGPAGHHFVNALLYALCAAFLAWLLMELTRSRAAALIGGILFAAHPVHTEAVLPVVGRSELLAFLGVIGGLALAVRVRSEDFRRGAAAAALFLAGLLSKEIAIVFLPAVLLLPPTGTDAPASFVARIQASARERWSVLAFAGLGTALWFVLRSIALTGETEPASYLNNPLAGLGARDRITGALEVLLTYHQKMLVPWPLSSDYSYAALVPDSMLLSAVGLGSLILLAYLATRPRVGFGFALYLLPLLVVGNLFFATGTIFGERLLFLPSAGICLVLGAWLGDLSARRLELRKPIAGVVGGFAILGVVGFAMRGPEWRDEVSLSRSITEAQPQSAKGHEKYGYELYHRWKEAGADRSDTDDLEIALAALERSVEIYPGYAQAHLHLSLVRLALGDPEGWLQSAENAYRQDPTRLDHAVNLAQAANNLGPRDRNHYLRALDVTSSGLARFEGHPHLLKERAKALIATGREPDEAYWIMKELAPDDLSLAPHYAFLLARRDQPREAIQQLDRILSLPPSDPQREPLESQVPELLNNRGIMFGQLGDPERALANYDAALERMPSFRMARLNRIKALITLGRLDDAREDIQSHREVLGEEQARQLLESLP